MPAAHLAGEIWRLEKERLSITEVLLHQHVTSKMAIMTSKQTKQQSKWVGRNAIRCQHWERIETLERADGERDIGYWGTNSIAVLINCVPISKIRWFGWSSCSDILKACHSKIPWVINSSILVFNNLNFVSLFLVGDGALYPGWSKIISKDVFCFVLFR